MLQWRVFSLVEWQRTDLVPIKVLLVQACTRHQANAKHTRATTSYDGIAMKHTRKQLFGWSLVALTNHL